jgi:hypothetical protein
MTGVFGAGNVFPVRYPCLNVTSQQSHILDWRVPCPAARPAARGRVATIKPDSPPSSAAPVGCATRKARVGLPELAKGQPGPPLGVRRTQRAPRNLDRHP